MALLSRRRFLDRLSTHTVGDFEIDAIILLAGEVNVDDEVLEMGIESLFSLGDCVADPTKDGDGLAIPATGLLGELGVRTKPCVDAA